METNQNMNIEELEGKIGYVFENKNYLLNALTHSSYVNENKKGNRKVTSNERLEFLGDSILSIIVSKKIYFDYPYLAEGDLTKIRSGAVCEKALAGYATTIGLGEYMFMGKGEEGKNGRKSPSVIADCFEAVIAAMYLDGGMEAARKFVLPFVEEEIKQMLESGHTEDYKTMLQHFVQKEHGDILEYRVISETGPSHDKLFEVVAVINGNIVGKGKGKSKREAEKNAAREALILFGADIK